jgi:hypothetical protein
MQFDQLHRREFITLIGGTLVTLPATAAESFPTRPIRLVVPYPAGGGTDIVGRILGQKLHESLGQPIVIDNRGGAGGTIGTALAAKSLPDGYTLLLVPTSHVINPSIYAKLPYDTEKDFAPITMVASAAILMAVHPRVPADTIVGFVEAAKARPQAIANYGSAGAGTVFHLTGELFKRLTGLALQHVPYRGGAPTRPPTSPLRVSSASRRRKSSARSWLLCRRGPTHSPPRWSACGRIEILNLPARKATATCSNSRTFCPRRAAIIEAAMPLVNGRKFLRAQTADAGHVGVPPSTTNSTAALMARLQRKSGGSSALS